MKFAEPSMDAEALVRIDAGMAKYAGPTDVTDAEAGADLYSLLREARALIPEPPTDDEREALARVIWNADNLDRAVLADCLRIADAVIAWRDARRGLITDEQKVRLAEDVLTYGHLEGLALEGYVRAAVRMTLEAVEAARSRPTGADRTQAAGVRSDTAEA